jgi:hypothetical protein
MEIGRILARLHRKLVRPHLRPWAGVVIHACCSSYTGGIGKRTVVEASPGKSVRPYLKNNQSKKGLVERLKR